MLADLISKNRSCRRFYQDHKIEYNVLAGLINLSRFSASAANLQPLKYIISADPSINDKIFSCLTCWAGYLKEWPGPDKGERPSAYIIILGDTTISNEFGCDEGISVQSITLGACEKGLACCILKSIDRPKLKQIFKLDKELVILSVIAIGKPKETIILDDIGTDGDIKYWRDENDYHHVPKRHLKDLIIQNY